MRLIFYFILIPALLPVFIILRYVYKKDRIEREPLGLVLKVFILGAFFALPCIPVERVLGTIITTNFSYDERLCSLTENIFGVALVEEFFKWLVLMIFIWKNNNFDYRYDGIVYAVTSSLGFAAIENVMYIISYGTGVSIGRAIFAIPGHATFGVFMGYFLSRAKHFKNKEWGVLKIIYLVLSIGVSVVIHGIYDFMLSDYSVKSGLNSYFVIYVIILDVFAWLTIRHEFKTDKSL